MKKKILKISLIILAIIIAFSLNNVNAATSWGGSNKNLTLNVDYATNNTTGVIEIDIPATSDTSVAGILVGCPNNHYMISGVNLGSGNIVTGWVQRSKSSETVYSGNAKLRINVGQTGTQQITIIAQDPGGNDWGTITSPTYNTVTVVCSYSSAFRTAAEKLGITFSDNNTSYNLDNINVYPTNYDYFEAIIDAKASYDNLNSSEKATLNSWISSKSTYSTFDQMYTAADNYLTSLANAFVTVDLQNQTTATRNNYNTIINANTAWTNLKTKVQNRVKSNFVDYPTLLVEAKAYQFIDTYNADNSNNPKLTKEVDKLILTSYPDAWNALDSDVKTRVWELIKNTNAVNGARTSSGVSDYPTWIAYVQDDLDLRNAEEFVNRNNLSNFDLNKFKVNNYIDIVNEGNEELAKSIVGPVTTDYNTLNENAKSKSATDTDMGSSFETIKTAAQNYLDAIDARNFINNNQLRTQFPASVDNLTTEEVEELEKIATKIVGLNNEYSELTTGAQDKVMGELGVTDFQTIIDNAQSFLDDLNDAKKFIEDNKLDKEMTTELAEAILDLDEENKFDDLSQRAQSMVNLILGKTFDELVIEADKYLDKVANDFIENNNLNKELTKQIASNTVELGDDFNGLSSDTVKARVLAKLGVESFDKVIEEAQEYLDNTAAQEFYDNYLDGMEAEKIVSGKDAWNKSSEKVQEKINKLLNDNDVNEKYPELLERAIDALNERAAQDFINDKLTKNSEVIKEANTSNAKQIIKAEEAYNLLSDEVKAKVNSKLTNVADTTYPELLKAAQDLQKNPKTGDSVVLMIGLLVVSSVGIIATRRRKRK